MKKRLLVALLFLSANAHAFSQPEITKLHAAINAEPSISACVTAGDHGCIAAWFNTDSTFIVWKSHTNKDDVFDNVIWANFTPANPSSGAGQDATNWLMACQGKALNLQTLLNANTISSSKANVRAGIQDATTNIPSGINGANKSGGWTAIQTVMQRSATYAEKNLATGTGTTGSPGLLTFEGTISVSDIPVILELP